MLLGRRAAQAVVDGEADAFFRNWPDGDARLWGRVGLVKQVEQAGGRFDEVAGSAEVELTGHFAEADQEFPICRPGGVEPQRF